MEEIAVKIISIAYVKDKLDYFLHFLTEEQINQSKNFKQQDDFLRSVAGFYFINRYTTNKELQYNAYGKPIKDGEFFNLAHSGDYVIFAQYDKPIGVDIEQIREYKPKLLDYVCNEQDKKKVKTKDDFFVMWTQKESLIKCIGTGLAKGNIKDVPAFPVGKKQYCGKTYNTRFSEYKDYVISVCLLGDKEFDIIILSESCNFN